MAGGEEQANDQLERVRAALADQYAIERELGSGGMATVYLANDLKHEREVAVKVLHPDLAASLGAERFLREIRITAKLSHPHILPLYDSGAAGGFLYYVMPFVQGESLADYVAREKQLSIREAVQIIREVAEALGHAHSHGLVHRDVKPQNVLMSGGHAIVADFGIARAVSEAGGDKLTQTGMAVGTPAYMSPEQIGGAEVDARSDIYALGCVLYEVLVGQVPFTGPTPMAVMARHSMDTIPPPNIMRPGIPDELEDIIHRAMAKVPADRFRTMYEMAEALAAVDTTTAMHRRPSTATLRRPAPARPRRRWLLIAAGVVLAGGAGLGAWRLLAGKRAPAGDAGGLDPRRIAVLYFQDLSRDSSLGHVADGLTEGLIQELSSVPGLDVISRNGVAPYRRTAVTADSVARALEVGSLIQGNIDAVGDRIRATARLVDGETGVDVDRASFDLPVQQLLVVRDSVVREVARLLRARLGDEVRLREQRAATASVDAWLLVQRAERVRKEAQSQRGDADLAHSSYARADSLLRLSSGADPDWPEPLTLRAQVAYERALLVQDRFRRKPWLDSAVHYATQALELQQGYPAALSLRGRARRALYRADVSPSPAARDRLLDSAEADLKAATQADGSQAAAYLTLSQLYYDKKDNVQAALMARHAYEADAFLGSQAANLNQLFWAYYDLEVFPDAQAWCQEGARRFPADYRFAQCQLWMMITEGSEPDLGRAWALADSVAQRAPESRRAFETHLARLIVGGALARAGLKDSARHVLDSARAGRDVDPEQDLPGYEAVMRIILGDHQDAIALLTNYVLVNPTHEFTAGRDLHWWWRPLRDFPEFRAVMARRH
jgi:serine/threonine-protein kinase